MKKDLEKSRKYSSKTGMVLELRATMPLKISDRALQVSGHTSRAIKPGEVHEFLVANDYGSGEGKMNDISYVGFFQFNEGGVIELGDSLTDAKGIVVGNIVGFDYTHLADGTQNHMNIVLSSDDRRTGAERGFIAGQEFRIPGYEVDTLRNDARRGTATVSEEMLKILSDSGVECIFGFPGETSFPLYANLQHFRGKHIIAGDERMAGHMADAYARLTNKIGVLEVPKVGALWIPPATLEAKESSIPMLVISSGSNQNKDGRHPTCDYDQTDMLQAVSKGQMRVENPTQMVPFLRKSLHTALGGKPAPVLLEIPSNVLGAQIEKTENIRFPIEYPIERPVASESSIKKALEILMTSKNPMILAGGGVHQSRAYAELFQLAETLNIPVATTINGKGAFDETHPLSVGVIGSKGDELSNSFLQTADLFLVVGSKLGDKSTNQYQLLNKGAKLVHLDIDPEEMGYVFEADAEMVGDAKASLARMNNMTEDIKTQVAFNDRTEDLAKRRDKRFEAYKEFEQPQMPVAPSLLFKTLNAIFKGNQIIVADGSSACGWASVFSITNGGARANINPRGSGMIGYGLPATIGAAAANIDRPIIGVGGDGGVKSTAHGIETAVQSGLEMTYFVLDDQRLSFMTEILEKAYGHNPLPTTSVTDLEMVAKGFGANSLTLYTNEELMDFLQHHDWRGVNIVVLKVNRNLQSPDLQISMNKKR